MIWDAALTNRLWCVIFYCSLLHRYRSLFTNKLKIFYCTSTVKLNGPVYIFISTLVPATITFSAVNHAKNVRFFKL